MAFALIVGPKNFINPLTARVKPWVMQTFDGLNLKVWPFIGKLLNSTLLWCFGVVRFNFTQFVILENLSILDLALSGVKGLIDS